MKKSKAITTLLVLIIGIPVIGAGILLATFDANSYRPQIAEALSRHLGRAVKLEGPIKLSISFTDGFKLSVSDISIANPTWASRPLLAKVGQADLGVGIQPLFERKVEITSFKLADGDVQLETNASGENNWQLAFAGAAAAQGGEKETVVNKGGKPVSIQVSDVNINNSRIAMRGKDGKVSVFIVQSLKLSETGKGVTLGFTGEMAGTPVTLTVVSGKGIDQLSGVEWPFAAEGQYANYKIEATGSLKNAIKNIELSKYALTSGDTKITGEANVALGGSRPVIYGTLYSAVLNVADFKPTNNVVTPEPVAAESGSGGVSSGGARLFSTQPLKLDALKSADAKIDIAIDEAKVGPATINQIATKLNLENGRLLLSPLKMKLAGATAEGQLKLDASSSPAQFSSLLNAQQLNLSELVQLGGLQSFMSGKGDLDFDLITMGNSQHDFASNASGHFNLVVAGGTVSSQALGNIAGNLLNIFAPGTGQLLRPDMNCMVARFRIERGVMQSNGILVDTAQATIVGDGDIDLGDEKINMLLRTKTKGVDVSAFTPPLRVSGSLKGPSFVPDTAGSVQKIAGLFFGSGVGDAGIPDVITQNGQNACLYTIEHPQAAKANTLPNNTQKAVEQARDKVKDVGNKLLKGLFGQ